jgi:hypothetical protein
MKLIYLPVALAGWTAKLRSNVLISVDCEIPRGLYLLHKHFGTFMDIEGLDGTLYVIGEWLFDTGVN